MPDFLQRWISNFRQSTRFQVRNHLSVWNLKIRYVLFIYNIEHALKDSRFILLKFYCLNVGIHYMHGYSSSEIENFMLMWALHPFPCPWQLLLINCGILGCWGLGNPCLCHRVFISMSIVHQEATSVISELVNMNPNAIATLIGLAVVVAMSSLHSHQYVSEFWEKIQKMLLIERKMKYIKTHFQINLV